MIKSNMIKNKIITLSLMMCCIGAFMLGSLSIANASKSSIAKIGKKSPSGVTLMLGKADMVTIGGEVADVLVADPSVVDVMAVKSNRCLLYTSPSPRDRQKSRMPSSA